MFMIGREQSRDEHEQQAPRQQASGRGGHGMQSSRSREQLSDLKVSFFVIISE
jgi:hypothetical protein